MSWWIGSERKEEKGLGLLKGWPEQLRWKALLEWEYWERHQFGTDGLGVLSGNNCEMLVIQGGNKINHSGVVEGSWGGHKTGNH